MACCVPLTCLRSARTTPSSRCATRRCRCALRVLGNMRGPSRGTSVGRSARYWWAMGGTLQEKRYCIVRSMRYSWGVWSRAECWWGVWEGEEVDAQALVQWLYAKLYNIYAAEVVIIQDFATLSRRGSNAIFHTIHSHTPFIIFKPLSWYQWLAVKSILPFTATASWNSSARKVTGW